MTGVLLETQQISTDCQLIVVLVLVAGLVRVRDRVGGGDGIALALGG